MTGRAHPHRSINWRSSRLVSVVQYLRNPVTGELLLDLDALLRALRSRRLITRWALIVHDADHGHPDGKHVHLVAIVDKKGIDRRSWAKWLGVPPEKVWQILGGENGVADCLIYMLHQGAAGEGKAKYDESQVVASPDWPWETLVRDRETQLAVTPRRTSRPSKLSVIGHVETGVLTVAQARLVCTVSEVKLQAARARYLRGQSPPRTRVGIHIQIARDLAHRDPITRAIAAAVIDGPAYRTAVSYDGCDYRWPFGGYDGETGVIFDGAGEFSVAGEFLDPAPSRVSRLLVDDTQLIHDTVMVVSADPPSGFDTGLPPGVEPFPVQVVVTAEAITVSAGGRTTRVRNAFAELVELTDRIDDPAERQDTLTQLSAQLFAPITGAVTDVRAGIRPSASAADVIAEAAGIGLGESINMEDDNDNQSR